MSEPRWGAGRVEWWTRLNVNLTALEGIIQLLTNPKWPDTQRKLLWEAKVLAA